MVLLWIDYAMISLPGILVATWAQVRILRANAEGDRIDSAAQTSGAETAALVIEAGGVPSLEIEPASGELSHYYDADRKRLRLSRDVFDGRSLTAMGISAHEAAHAIQHSEGYRGLIVRNAVVPLALLGSQVCWILLMAGLWLGMARLIVLAIGLFWIHLLIQLANVPVELDASRRAREALRSEGLVTADEDGLVARIANAAAWTDVATVLWGNTGQWLFRSRRWKRNRGRLDIEA